MAAADGSGYGHNHSDSRPIARRSLLAGGAAMLAGAGLLAPASALASPAASAKKAQSGGGSPLSLSPAQQVGQRVIWSYSGLTPPQALFDAITAGIAGGVIFFGANIDATNYPAQIQGVTDQLTQAQEASGIDFPLMIMTDQEGGIVQRLPGAPGLSEKQIGESADPVSTASSAGTSAAQNMLSAGVNTNLAPVLDVYRVPGNFDDEFGRSYSMDPNVCAECGAASITAQQALGIVTTAKHFPGLGAATVDQNTDLGPVTLDVPLSDLRSIDEKPFRSAIGVGVDMVMTSWAIYPALDADRPSGLSPRIIHGELRGRLGFRGVTITDAIEAGALENFGDIGQRAVTAAAAGMDILLASAQDVTEGQTAVDALEAALTSGQLAPGAAKQALARVLALRSSLR